jgi:hypothetical protein
MFETDTVLPPDPVIEAYKKDIDRTLIRENLKLTPDERLKNLERLQEFAEELRRAGKEKLDRRNTVMSTKDIETKAFEYLRVYFEKCLPGAMLIPAMNKGRGKATAIGDALLEYNGQETHIEIKASRSARLPTNLRFTHQTISAALGKDLVVAVVWNLDNERPEVGFFKLSSVSAQVVIEPHFIVQSKYLKGKDAIAGIFSTDIEPILNTQILQLDLSAILETTVAKHVRKNNANL